MSGWSATLTFDRFSPAILPLLASEKQLQILPLPLRDAQGQGQDDEARRSVNRGEFKIAGLWPAIPTFEGSSPSKSHVSIGQFCPFRRIETNVSNTASLALR
jgi:hypothetical protein